MWKATRGTVCITDLCIIVAEDPVVEGAAKGPDKGWPEGAQSLCPSYVVSFSTFRRGSMWGENIVLGTCKKGGM